MLSLAQVFGDGRSGSSKATGPSTSAELPPFSTPPRKTDTRRQTLLRVTRRRISLGVNLREPPMPRRESDAAAGRRRGRAGGEKCNVIAPSKAKWDPLPGLTETGRTPATHPATLPAPPRAPPDSSGISGPGNQQGLQLGGEFLASSLWLFHCLCPASRCSSLAPLPPQDPPTSNPPHSRPPRCFDIVPARGGKGHARQRRAGLTGNE